jgi:outer membrane protein assembly factor BamB
VAEAATVIKAAGLTPRELAGLFLVGGSSRVPMVARLLHGELGISPTVLEQPELPVSEGAIRAAGASGTLQWNASDASTAAASPAAKSGPASLEPAAGSASAAGGTGSASAAGATGPGSPAAAGTASPAAAGSASPPLTTTAVGPPTAVAGPPTEVDARPTTDTVPAEAQRPAEAALKQTPPAAAAPKPTPPAPALPRDPDYAEPVDPWATGEAAAIAAAGGAPLFPSSGAPAMRPTPTPPAHESWLASAQPDNPVSPAGPYVPGADGRRAAYRKKWVLIVAAATVVVLGAGAALAWVFWPGYPALDYAQQLGPAKVVAPLAPVSYGFSDSAIIGDRVYFASTIEDSVSSTADRLGVVAADVDSGAKIWGSDKAGTAERWERMVAIPAGVALLTDSESGTGKRRFAVLGAERGDLLWQRTIDRDDAIFFVDAIAVLVDRTEDRLLGLDINSGKVRWEEPNLKNSSGTATASVYQVTTPADLSGPAGVSGVPFAPDQADDKRIVQVSADRSARVLDTATGRIGPARPGVADYDDPVIAHNGRLIVRESSTPQRIVAYDLAKLNEGQPRVLYQAKGDNLQLTALSPCGEDGVCWIEEASYDAATAQVAGVNAADASGTWHRGVAGAESLVPVGDSVLVTSSTSPASVSLLDADGEITWTKEGVAARLDGGNLLTLSEPLSTSAVNLALAGQHLGDGFHQLGPLSGVRSSTCSWNTSVIACVRDKDFTLQRFTD